MADLVELNEHFGLTPANIVMVDRRLSEPTITYIDTNGGLQSMLLADASGKEVLPPHFKSENSLGVHFNYNLIAGFVEAGPDAEYIEVHIKGAEGRLPSHFEIRKSRSLRMYDIADDYSQVVGGIPGILFRDFPGNQLKVITPKAPGSAAFAKSILDLKIRAKRPGADGPDVKAQNFTV